MQRIGTGTVTLLGGSLCYAQDTSDLRPPFSNVLDAQYPKVDSNSHVRSRSKAPEALKVQANGWSSPKVDVEKLPKCAERLAKISSAIDFRAIWEQSYGCLARRVSEPIHVASIAGSVNRIKEGGQTR